MTNLLRWGNQDNPSFLVVLCHGVGADAGQMGVFADAWAATLPALAFAAPDAPERFDQVPPGVEAGHQWFSLRDRTPMVLDAAARRTAPSLDTVVDAECRRLSLPPGQVALAGFSQGAMMVLHAGLRRRPAPAAILAYAGALLDTPDLAESLSGHPPVLLVHGMADEVVPFTHGPAAQAALQRLGLPVDTCWCPGTGHFVDDRGLRAGLDFLRKILAQDPGARPWDHRLSMMNK